MHLVLVVCDVSLWAGLCLLCSSMASQYPSVVGFWLFAGWEKQDSIMFLLGLQSYYSSYFFNALVGWYVFTRFVLLLAGVFK